jgi:N-acetylmuramoyl-L-alanine amidase
MDKEKLYTLRWHVKNKLMGSAEDLVFVQNLISELLGEERDVGPEPDRELVGDGDDIKLRLVLIVGHEKRAPGADLHGGGSEYEYNTDIARLCTENAKVLYPNLEVHTVFRDGVGISGAYKRAALLNPDCCIELHFNAANNQAKGTETLCTFDSIDSKFAEIVQAEICKAFERGGMSRGVKKLTRNARGGGNVHSLPGDANCLVEPFFGDTPSEAKLAREKKEVYSHALLEACVKWAHAQGISLGKNS